MRYLRLYLNFLKFSLSHSMEFRFDFFFRIFMDIFFYSTNVIFFIILFHHTDLLGGWTREETLIFVSTYLLGDAIYMTFYANNCWWFPFYVNKGDLDYYLLRPVSSLFFLTLREFSPNSMVNLLMAVGIMYYSFGEYIEVNGSMFPGLRLSIFAVMVLLGTIIQLCMNLIFIFPVFWTHSERGLHNLLDNAMKLGERPHLIYSGWMARILTSVLPFAMIASFPCYFLFSKDLDMGLFWHHLITVLGFSIFVLIFWKFALRSYSSASS